MMLPGQSGDSLVAIKSAEVSLPHAVLPHFFGTCGIADCRLLIFERAIEHRAVVVAPQQLKIVNRQPMGFRHHGQSAWWTSLEFPVEGCG